VNKGFVKTRTLLPYPIIIEEHSLADQEPLSQFFKRVGIHPFANYGVGVLILHRMINAGVNFG